MADPLSVLGAAVGVTSLIMQITDGCIKGFKFYHEAVNLPEAYHHLRVRLHIEQQRFLNFGLEAGILYADGVICDNLRVNRSLLVAVLAEIKALLDDYVELNGKYEQFTTPEDVNWGDVKEPETDLMGLLCLPPDNRTKNGEEDSEATEKKPLYRVRNIGQTVAQTGRNLRAIVIKPKRLVWATVDKESFELLSLKIEKLISFLIGLLDSSQLRRLQDTMDTTYLEILQLRNDVVSLKDLVKALTPMEENRQDHLHGKIDTENNSLSQAAGEETKTEQNRKSYLKQLAKIKIQFTTLNTLNGKDIIAIDLGKFTGNALPLGDFEFTKGTLKCDSPQQRISATYQGGSVWIEWKDVPRVNNSEDDKLVESRIGLLTDLLHSVKPDGFRAPPCLGYIKLLDGDHARFGIVFRNVLAHSTKSSIVTLRELLGRCPKPSLSSRISLCAVLARCIHSFHAVNWLHKALRADNIIFLSSPDQHNLNAPYVTGFELSRPSIMDQMTEKPRHDPSQDIYRHPNAQSSQVDGSYCKSYDLYSFGILIIEIALWMRIEDIMGFENLKKVKPTALLEIQSRLLGRPQVRKVALPPNSAADCVPYLEQVASACGDVFCNIAKRCLEVDMIEEPQFSGEQEIDIALRLQRITENDIVQKLEHIARTL
ncbi:hypothetical protein ACLOAV_005509 [Pseudogymnoascus australis]